MRAAALTGVLVVVGCSSPEPVGDPARPEAVDEVPAVVARPVAPDLAGADGAAIDGGVPGGVAPVGISSSCEVPLLEGTAGVRMRVGEVYTRRGARPLRYDLALPGSGDGPFPLVILVHGGGWRAGERLHLREEIAALARRGYAAASLDYRLVPAGVFPAAVADVRCAVRHFHANASNLSVDPERFAIGGFSAGAQLSALVALAPDADGLDDCDTDAPLTVRALLSWYPPVDFRSDAGWNDATRGVLGRFLGALPADAPDLAVRASPIEYVSTGDPATLLIHGTGDETVPVDQSRRFAAALRAASVPVTYVELEGAGHGFPMFAPRPSLRAAPCTTLAFLDHVLR